MQRVIKYNIGLTLVEVIVSLAVLSILILTIYRSYGMFLNNISYFLRRADTHMQIDFAFDHFRLHVLNAIRIDKESLFTANEDGTKDEFAFEGEADYNNITPDNDSDNACYKYYINSSGFFVVEKTIGCNASTKPTYETLISNYLKPKVTFQYVKDTEPNFMKITIEAGGLRSSERITKTEGIRLLFVDVVQ
ncbi:MAG: type II secretion system GspH family protein [Candidatus Omnitrophica bacterium]|nr:type II secretion system GspH family protein [Candidatus Omnitrophota bacterium]